MKYKWMALLAVLVLFFSCDTGGGGSTTPAAPTLSDKIDNALYSIPQSLQGGSSTTSSSLRAVYQEVSDSLEFVYIYGLIEDYMGFAEHVRDFLEELILAVVDNDLASLEVDTFYVISDGSGEDPTAFSIEEDDTYDFKIHLYFEPIGTVAVGATAPEGDYPSIDPELTLQFSEADGGVEGEVWFSFSEDEDIVDPVVDDYTTDISIYAAFDSDGDDGTLSLRVFVDPVDLTTSVEEAAAATYANEDESDDSEILFTATRIFLDLSKSGDEVSVIGSTYHPYLDNIPEDGWIVPDHANRQVYSFTAIANSDGAKVNLALPDNTLNDVSNIWTDDSLGERWKEVVVNQINGFLGELGDDDAGTPEDMSDSSVALQNFIGAYLMNNVIDFGLNDITHYQSNDYSGAQLAAARTFWTSTEVEIPGLLEDDPATNDYDAMLTPASGYTDAQWVIGINDFNQTNESADQEWIYLVMMAPELVAAAESAGWALPSDTPAELDTSAAALLDYGENADENDEWAQGVLPWVMPILYMSNPAYFTDSSGLVGTYNAAVGEDGTFYGPAELDNPPPIYDALETLDLSTLTPFVPAEVTDPLNSFVHGEVPSP